MENNPPFFTVVIPSYNRAHLIKKAIKSVLNQTYENWELIIVDDASTDNTAEVIREFDEKRIKYVALKQNKGNAGARNEGVKQSKGEYIFFLDSDDEMHPEALECFKQKYNKTSKIDFAFGGYQTRNKKTGVITDIFWEPKKDVPFIKELKIGTGCGLFVRNDIFDKVGLFDESLRVAVDTDWLIRLDNMGYRPTILKDILVTVNIHDGERVRKDKTELLKSYHIIFEKNQDLIESDNSLKKKFFYKLQWLNYHQENIVEGNKFFYKMWTSGLRMKKSFFVFLIFNCFNQKFAKEMHLKISGQKI